MKIKSIDLNNLKSIFFISFLNYQFFPSLFLTLHIILTVGYHCGSKKRPTFHTSNGCLCMFLRDPIN